MGTCMDKETKLKEGSKTMTDEEAIKAAEKEGFEVVDEIEIGTLEDVKEIPRLIPPARNAKLQIGEVKVNANEAGTYRSLNVRFVISDGIDINGELKYKGMGVFSRVCYYADPAVYIKDFFKNKQHLVALKQLVAATQLSDATKMNDAFCAELKGQIVLGNIIQRKAKAYTDKLGNEQPGEPSNEVVNFKKVPDEELV